RSSDLCPRGRRTWPSRTRLEKAKKSQSRLGKSQPRSQEKPTREARKCQPKPRKANGSQPVFECWLLAGDRRSETGLTLRADARIRREKPTKAYESLRKPTKGYAKHPLPSADTRKASDRLRLLAQHELLHLAGRGLGQSAEDHGLRAFEVRKPFAAEVDDVLLARGGAFLECHERARRLAPFLVGPRHHRAFQHGRMAVDHALDLDRRDVLAARDDDVLGAVLQLDIAVGVADAEIAGVEPAAREGVVGRLGVLQV